ncbi:MAG: HlyD family type I secretion periplasmic adaptor subunit [Alphaproteobacteria bacterium]
MADAPRYGALAPIKPAPLPAPYDPPPETVPADMGIVPATRWGLVILVLFFGVLGGWAAFVPLSSAAIATGVVSPDSSRRTIQHLEGGVVHEILVRNGDEVEKNQVLVRLESTQSSAAFAQFRSRHRALSALEARLVAERDGLSQISFPPWILAEKSVPAVAEAIAAQNNIFNARRQGIEGQVAILKQRIAQSREEILGLRDQIAADEKQLVYAREEVKDLSTLFEKGLAQKPRLLAIQRREAEIEGARAQKTAAVARARQAIGEAELRIIDLKTTQLNEVVGQLRDAQVELAEVAERLRAAEDVLKRVDIVSPIAGTVVAQAIFTAGGVVTPGQKLMDIVPKNDTLVIDAQISPQDIEMVHQGLEAQVRFSAFSQRVSQTVSGRVATVSADRLVDQNSGQVYYMARIELTEDAGPKLGGGAIQAGMSAEVMIITGKRTALDYLFRPLLYGANRAFREN